MLNTLNLKTCKYCGVAKPREEFPPNPRMTDLRENRCKKCRCAYVKAKRDSLKDSDIRHF